MIEQAMSVQGMDAAAPMGPGRPISPYQGYSRQPRAMDYPAGINISTRSRETWHRPSFDTIRNIIDAYDIARACINHKIDELRSMEPLFTAADGVTSDVSDAVDAARIALSRPDRENPFGTWLGLWLEGLLRYDAGVLYRRRNMAGEVIGLEVVDPTTITPWIDEHGRLPRPPADAYGQIIKGIVWQWYSTDDLIYSRFRPQVDSPYGLAPIESILLTANTDIRFQWWFLQTFTDGAIPAAFGEMPPDMSSPDQIAEFQDAWDAVIEGDQSQQHKVRWLPPGGKITPIKENTFDTLFAEYLMTRTCSAYGVVPQDLGLVKDVNKANGETQVDVQFRVNTLPWVRFANNMLTDYVQHDLRLPVQVNLDTGRDKEDRLQEANAWKIYVETGIASVDEAREQLLGLPTDNERPIPRFIFSPRTGPVPLLSLLAISGVVDAETGAPVDEQPLPTVPFAGAGGVLADKSPGGTQFHRAPIDPDEPMFPELEKPVPGSDVVGTKPGAPVIGTPIPVAKAQETAAELAAFRSFVKARRRQGKWRDFEFAYQPAPEARRLNDEAASSLTKAVSVHTTPPDAGQSRWSTHPVTHVQDALITTHTPTIGRALEETASLDELTRLAAEYLASHADA
ncbi:MAG: phage portal protein [Dermatophilaceae bacterium]